MKFTLNWLKQHLDTTASLDEICDRLTALGLEVEGVDDQGKRLAPFIMAQILEAEKHPQADRLKVCVVDTGKEKIQVVCGAPNARAGIKVVLARPGDAMPDSGEVLKKGVIRGVESQGMMCALDELGLGGEHAGIIELPADAPLGESYARFAKLDDAIVEINVTPNRPDCTGVRGIARDLAAAGVGVLKDLDLTPVKGAEPNPIKIKLEFAPDDFSCPHFVGRHIRNIQNKQSPAWLQQRLQSIGLRPISALVDITNYMTFDLARPLHVFDAKKIKGNLWVRPAKAGETLEALNGKNYMLEEGMTVIGDDTGVLSLAGIMGGVSTSCDETTTDLYLESAFFSPTRTARTGRALQITSDARYRFERGIDPAFTLEGAELATKLILELCGTAETKVSDLEIAGSAQDIKRHLPFDEGKTLQRVGVDVSSEEQIQILTRLGFDVKTQEGRWIVTTPSWRPDVEGDADLVEEIIRVKGLDTIQALSLPRDSSITPTAIDVADQRVHAARRSLAGQGLMEALTWTFMPSGLAAQFGAIDANLRLLNPISSDLDVMRPSVLGNLVQAAKRNADKGFADVGLFEVGPVFKNASPQGQETIATSLRAGSTSRHWVEASRLVDAFDAKADALAALVACGAPVTSLQITTDAPVWYHPGRSGSLRLGNVVLAHFGEIHPQLLTACDASGTMVGCEIFLAKIPQSRTASTARPLLKLEPLQSVSRDFAFVMDRNVTAAKLVRTIKDADKILIRDVTVFDLYEGERIGADKKSLALSVTLQPTGKSLTDVEIEALTARVISAVEQATGAVLRS